MMLLYSESSHSLFLSRSLYYRIHSSLAARLHYLHSSDKFFKLAECEVRIRILIHFFVAAAAATETEYTHVGSFNQLTSL